jgi:hypothetical protein
MRKQMPITALQMSPTEARNQNFGLTISRAPADRLSDITLVERCPQAGLSR